MALTGQQLIAAERSRQIESENWSANHDDDQGSEKLELAALCYRNAAGEDCPAPANWPWAIEWWKPKSRQRNLERAGALYQASADAAERAHDFERRDDLWGHVASCGILLDSVITRLTKTAEKQE